MFGDGDDMVELLPSVPDQPLFDATVEIGSAAKRRDQHRFDVMDGGHELSAFPGHAGIVGKMEHVVRADQEGGHLLPETATKQREANQAKPHIGSRSKRMLAVRDQNLVLIRLINAPQRLNQLPGISPDPDVEIFEMPCGNDDLHDMARNRPWWRKKTGSTITHRTIGRIKTRDGMATDQLHTIGPHRTTAYPASQGDRMEVARADHRQRRLTESTAYVTD